uniref:Uncharacterized protein n=1 Tax=Glossina palpalis gambiensis TaxID=67801 RepID=A0A1B0ARE3_9MUSC
MTAENKVSMKQSSPSFSLASSFISLLYSCLRKGSLGPQSFLGLKALKNLSRHVVPGSRTTATINHMGICKTPTDVIIQPKAKNNAMPRAHCHCLTLGKLSFIAATLHETIPILEPTPKINNMRKNRTEKICGNMAKKYEAFPELLTPRIITTKTQNQDMNKPTTSCQFGAPMPSSMFSFSLNTSLLEKEDV